MNYRILKARSMSNIFSKSPVLDACRGPKVNTEQYKRRVLNLCSQMNKTQINATAVTKYSSTRLQ